MKNRYIQILFALLIIIGVASIWWWITNDPTEDFITSMPNNDRDSTYKPVMKDINIGEFFTRFSESNSSTKESWTRFRGNNFDNIYKSDIKLLDKFPETGPEVLWQIDMGEGHAGAAIYEGKVYVLDYNEEERADMLRCFDLYTGEELWRRWYKVNIKRNHGISRTVPAVNDKYIITIGPKCQVMCVNRLTGDFIWGLDIGKTYESEIPLWYTGQCPLLDDDVAIIATGGKALLIGIDCATGNVLWETPNKDGWKMSHSSIMPFTYKGKKMYVYSAVGGICGIGAADDNMGKLLWSSSAWNHSVVSPSPVCMPDGKIFVSAGYGAGSMMLQLNYSDAGYSIDPIDEFKPVSGLACEQQTPLFYKNHLIGIMPKDAGKLRNQLVCVNPLDCKKMVWTSDKASRFGLGPYIIANDKIYLLNDDGTLYIIQASVSGYNEISNYKVMEGTDAWAPMAIADGLLILRDSKTMICLNLKI